MSSALRSIPLAPGSVPVLGHLPSLLRGPLEFLSATTDHDLVRVRLGPSTAVLVRDPQLTQQVLRDDKTFDKGGAVIERLRESLGNGLITCPHRDHRRLRRLVQPAFQPARIPGYATAMSTEIAAVTGSWRDGQVLDVLRTMMTIASRSATATLFSDALAARALRTAHEDLYTLLAGVFRRIMTPAPLDRLPTPGNRRYHRARHRLRDTLSQVVAHRRASGGDHDDLLSALLTARDAADGRGLTDEEIRDQLTTFFLAGTETTASIVSWALHLIARHPSVERRLHAEVDEVLAGRPATHSDLARLPFTGRIITETLRMRSSGWMVTRVVTSDTRLGGHALPEGTTIMYSPYLLQHRADAFPEPHRFDPDRWAPDHPSPPPRESYIPFGSGSRKCPGDTFGTIETILALATIATRWRLRPASGRPVRMAPTMALLPRDLTMRLEART